MTRPPLLSRNVRNSAPPIKAVSQVLEFGIGAEGGGPFIFAIAKSSFGQK